jgi:hypothetical protein
VAAAREYGSRRDTADGRTLVGAQLEAAETDAWLGSAAGPLAVASLGGPAAGDGADASVPALKLHPGLPDRALSEGAREGVRGADEPRPRSETGFAELRT